MSARPQVVRLDRAAVPAVIDVLCESFFDYPVMRFVLAGGSDYDNRLRTLVALFVAARALRNDPMFGVQDEDRLVAVMTTSNPSDPPHPSFAAVRADAWGRLGAESEQRYGQCVQAWESLAFDRPQLHVNMIGVRDAYRGMGFGKVLLHAAHDLARESRSAEGVSLTTEEPRNVEFYRHLGYDVIGHTRVAAVLPTWSLVQPIDLTS